MLLYVLESDGEIFGGLNDVFASRVPGADVVRDETEAAFTARMERWAAGAETVPDLMVLNLMARPSRDAEMDVEAGVRCAKLVRGPDTPTRRTRVVAHSQLKTWGMRLLMRNLGKDTAVRTLTANTIWAGNETVYYAETSAAIAALKQLL